MRFAVGLKLKAKSEHVIVDAALKVKTKHPDAHIMYVRRANKRGDARHPPQKDE